MVLTPSLDAVYEKNLELFGEKITHKPDKIQPGSSDVGNISQVVPTIQTHISISDKKIAGHSIDFVEAAAGEKALNAIGLGANVLALTALDLIEDPELLKKVKEDHRWHVEHQKEIA